MDLRFADCELNLDRFELRRDGDVVDVEPQVFEVLAYLVRHRDRVVPKGELLDEIWGDRFVSESALTSRIKFARRAIGDTGRDQRLIKTVHGRGYRFVAEVDEVDATAARPAPGAGGGHRRVRPVGDGPVGPADDEGLTARVLEALAGERGLAIALGSRERHVATEALERLYDEVVDQGFLAARGSASGAGMRLYGCVVDALDELLVRAPALAKNLPTACQAELERCIAGQPPSTRQRLFLAVRELLVGGASERGIVLLFDDVDLSPPDTWALVEHAARLTRRHRVVVVVAHGGDQELGEPFETVALGDTAGDGRASSPGWDLPPAMIDALTRVAVGGPRFDAAELRAAGRLDGLGADHLLDVALARGVVESLIGGHFQFTDPAHAAALVEALPPHRRDAIRRETAERLAAEGAAPERVAEHLLAANDPAAAVPAALDAARRAAEVHAYADVLRWVDAVVAHAVGEVRGSFLTLRARALATTGEASAVAAYREALAGAGPDAIRGLRAELARAALFAGDFDTAREALEGLEPDGGPDDVAIVLAKGGFAYFTGEIDAAEGALEALRGTTLGPGPSTSFIDTVALQGLIAHDRGEWFDRLRRELLAAGDSPDLVTTIFDSHLCVAEYLLYGPMPYQEVVVLARELRRHAERVGARRAAAFAVCLAGEAELLAGELEAARRDLQESLELHRGLAADAGTAHSLQRLAELELASGNRAAAEQLLREAIPLARWSPLSNHLLQRIYGTLIAAQPDLATALDAADEAVAVGDEPASCEFCGVMVEVPAAMAYAAGGRLEAARMHLLRAEAIAARWHGTAWQAAVKEATAVFVQAEGHQDRAEALFLEAAALFDQAGHTLDAERCREAAEG